MIDNKEHYRKLSSEIWTDTNINKAQYGINKNLMKVLNSKNVAIMVYIAMKDEVDVIKDIDTSSQLQIPYMKNNQICRSEFSGNLKYDELGFLVPKNPRISDVIPEVIIVPGRIFDRTGNRIGRGGGHYDKFLSEHIDSLFVGISLDKALNSLIPYETHDIKMDIIITEKEILYIN
tara:strand:+ start:3755 stop:4282 length:528 start_codon:yes stop_codon:yes gene_type:complete